MIPAAAIIPLLISLFFGFHFWRGWTSGKVAAVLRRKWWSWETEWRYAHRDEDPHEYHSNMRMHGACCVFFLFVAWLEG